MVLGFVFQDNPLDLVSLGNLASIDAFNPAHQTAIIVLFLALIAVLYVFIKTKRFLIYKGKSKDYDINVLNKQFYALLIILLGVTVTVFLNEWAEIIAALVVVLAAIWLFKLTYNKCNIKYLYLLEKY